MTRRRDAVSDDAVMAAVVEVLGRDGPGAPLAAMAARAGLSAPRLIQRHGSRDRLILAAFEWWAARHLEALDRAGAGPRPRRALLNLLTGGRRKMSARELAVGAQWLVVEWASPALRGFNRRFLPRLRDRLAAVLRAAVRTGELAPHDSRAVAERLVVYLFGMALYYPLMHDADGYRRELRRAAGWLLPPR